MRGKGFIAGVLAGASVLVWGVPSRGDDVVRLDGVGRAPARNLVGDGRGADTLRTWYHGWGWGYPGWGWGGYRSFGWGGYGLGYRSFGWGGYGLGYRGFGWGGFYRPFYGYGLGYGRGLGYGLGGFGWGGFYPRIGIGWGLFGPCAGASAGVYTLSIPTATLGTPLPKSSPPRSASPAPQQIPPQGGTYPYDGGPANPVPKSKTKTTPTAPSTPQRTLPLDGRSVSLPKSARKWSYPAYGEAARRISNRDQTVLTRGRAK